MRLSLISGATVGVALCGRPLLNWTRRVATEGHPYSCAYRLL